MPVIKLKDFRFYRLLEWEETATRVIAKKRVLSKCTPTPEAEVYVTMPKAITLRARVNSTEKKSLWSIYNECTWQELKENDVVIEDVWLEEPNFRWDSSLGCGDRPWIATLGLICSNS